ncbi:MAG: hypothetical protein C0490_18785 [Marivirga sp.]|nr:hypothetical protein [Marivirga sp.]
MKFRAMVNLGKMFERFWLESMKNTNFLSSYVWVASIKPLINAFRKVTDIAAALGELETP